MRGGNPARLYVLVVGATLVIGVTGLAAAAATSAPAGGAATRPA
jgi:hypothetical protein